MTANTSFDTTNNGGLASGANITFGKTLNGSANNGQSVTLNAGTAGVVSVAGSIGNANTLSTLTLTQSNGATFSGPVATGTSVVLTSTADGQVIRFAGNLTTPTLTTTNRAYALEILGTTTTITNATNFLNTGALTLGDAVGDTLNFTGGLTATSASVVNLAGTFNTNNSPILLGSGTTPVQLNANVTMGTGTGNVTFGGLLNGNQELVVNSAGITSFNALVGSVTPLARITTDALGTVQINAASVATSGTQTYNDAMTLLSNTVLSSTGAGALGNISFNNTITGDKTLTVNTAGTTLFDKAVSIGQLTTDLAGFVQVNAPTIATTGTQTYNDAMTLLSNTVLSSTGAGAAGNISFNNTITGDKTLTVNTAGTTLFDKAVSIAQLTTDLAGFVQVNAPTIATTGTQTFNDPMTLLSNTVLSSTGAGPAGNISFNNTITGDKTLDVNTAGTTLFDKAVSIGQLTTDLAGAVQVNAPTIATTGTQTYNDAMTLLSNTVLSSTGAAAAGNITFNSTVDGAKTLAVNTAGNTTFNGRVGNTTALMSLTTDAAGTTNVNGLSVKTIAAQTYNDDVVVGANAVFSSVGDAVAVPAVPAGNIVFSKTLTGAFNVDVNTAANTLFNDNVNIAQLTTDAPGTVQINAATVTTSGTQTYNDAMTLLSNTVLSSTGAGPAGNITFNRTVEGAKTLTVNTAGNTLFNDNVNIAQLTTDAPGTVQINAATVTTSGTQTYNDALTLLNHTVLSSTGVAAAGNISFNSTIGGAKTLAVNTAGNTLFNDNVNIAQLTTDAPGTVQINAATVTTSGTQTFNDALTLLNNTTLASTGVGAAGNISFNKTIDGAKTLAINTAGTILFNDQVGSVTPLTSISTGAQGSILFQGAVGAAPIHVKTVTGQTFNNPIVLGVDVIFESLGQLLPAPLAQGDITFNGAINGGFNLTVNTAGVTNLNGPLGAVTTLASVTTDAGGRVQFGGTGTVTTLSGDNFTGTYVRTTGAQTYNDTVTLVAHTMLESSNAGNLTFGSTVDGGFDLKLNTAGVTALNAPVGFTAPLMSITTDAQGTTQLNAGTVKTVAAQTFNDPVTLIKDTTLTSTTLGDVTFNNTLDGGFALTVNTGGKTVFNNQVGAATALTSITTDAAGSAQFQDTGPVAAGATPLVTIKTTGAQTYNDQALLASDTTFVSGADLVFNNTIDGAFNLTINTAGQTQFNNQIGATARLKTITTDAPGSVRFKDSVGTTVGGVTTYAIKIYTTGAQAFNDKVILENDATFDTTKDVATGANITFGDTVNGVADGVQSLTLNSGTAGLVSVVGAMGDVRALKTFTLTNSGGQALPQ
ncbi:hypothetical protein [Limnohabitans sp.]|uniref:beta strand repeat-containing protein n=1 Tax=Limnohabitans sp. TaxID=1907725 RepID=UPI00286F2D2A|nr:hypothetical protein [Limnohabitans sp.]